MRSSRCPSIVSHERAGSPRARPQYYRESPAWSSAAKNTPFSLCVRLQAVVLSLCATASAGWGMRLQIDSVLSEGGGLGLRAGLSSAEGEAVLLVSGWGSALQVRAGFSSPLVAAGPLSPAGLLRQAQNPLGFDAGSGVFTERTGFVLNGSLSGGANPGLLIEPIPGHLGLFVCGHDGGEWTAGCFTAIGTAGFVVEGLLEASDPPRRTAPDEWYLEAPTFSGGGVVHVAGRVRWDAAPFSGALAAGLSGCGTSPPGAFLQSSLSIGGPQAGADLLLAGVSRDYRLMDGGTSLDLLEAAARLRARGMGARAVLCHAARARGPGRPRLPCMRSSARTSFLLEKDLLAVGRTAVGARAEGERTMRFDGEGRCTESAAAGCSLVWGPADRECCVKAELRDGLYGLSGAVRGGGPAAIFSAEAGLDTDGKTASLSAAAGLRVSLTASSISLRAGVRGLTPGCRDPLSCALFRLEWSAASEWR